MILHVHDSPGGDQYVAHLNREEATNLVRNLSEALANNEDADQFSLTLGHPVPTDVQEEEA